MISRPKFNLGDLYITKNALDLVLTYDIDWTALMLRHHSGDWGDLDPHDIRENENALLQGNRLFSSYNLPNGLGKLWIITEADRSTTTILKPEDY